jgi:hypothetical protein
MPGRSLLPPILSQLGTDPESGLPIQGPPAPTPTNVELLRRLRDNAITEAMLLEDDDAWKRFVPSFVRPDSPDMDVHENRARDELDRARRRALLNVNTTQANYQRVAGAEARPLNELQQQQLAEAQALASQRERNQQQYGLGLTDAQLATHQRGLSAQTETARQNDISNWFRANVQRIAQEHQQQLREGKSIDQARQIAALQLAQIKGEYEQLLRWQRDTLTQPYQEATRQANMQWNYLNQDAARMDEDNRAIYATQNRGAIEQRNKVLTLAADLGKRREEFLTRLLQKMVTPEQMDAIEARMQREQERAGVYSKAARSSASLFGTPTERRAPRLTLADFGINTTDPTQYNLDSQQQYLDWVNRAYPHIGPMQPPVPEQTRRPPPPEIGMPPDYVGPPPHVEASTLPAEVVAMAQQYLQTGGGNPYGDPLPLSPMTDPTYTQAADSYGMPDPFGYGYDRGEDY